ncbi:MAG: type II toxin-antitoxin system VapC family toxin [Acidobacteria bacterium]|nr:type II toxin-antitoxin system VapC family toxin [Acidobacteriota bacterium]
MLYLDSSALAKRYVAEPGSDESRLLMEANQGRLFTSVATWAEVLSALARCARENRCSTREYRLLQRAFSLEWNALHPIDVTLPVLAPAGRLIERHALRAYDAIQLCSALWIGRPLFACFDERLRRAAAAEGLAVAP